MSAYRVVPGAHWGYDIVRSEDGRRVARTSDTDVAERIVAALNLTAAWSTEVIVSTAAIQERGEPMAVVDASLHQGALDALRAIAERAPLEQPTDSDYPLGDMDTQLHTDDAWYEAGQIARPVLARLKDGSC